VSLDAGPGDRAGSEAGMVLTASERFALENLSRKAGGETVAWINIAAARDLTEKGLCERDRQGWRITSQGSAWLLAAEPLASTFSISEPTQLRP
jgi:hypothetical protein